MIRRAPPAKEGSSKYAFTGPPPAVTQAAIDMGHRLAWVRHHHQDASRGVRKWADLLKHIGYPLDSMTVHRYEKAKLLMPATYLWVVAKISGADPGWLLTGKGWPPPGYSRSWVLKQPSMPQAEEGADEETASEPEEDYAKKYPRRKPRGPRKPK